MHVPLKALHSRSMKRRITSPQLSESEASVQESPSLGLLEGRSPSISIITPIISPDGGGTSSETATNVPEDEIFSSGSELHISDSPILGSPADKRVQFITGCISDIPEHSDDNCGLNGGDDGPNDRKHRRKR